MTYFALRISVCRWHAVTATGLLVFNKVAQLLSSSKYVCITLLMHCSCCCTGFEAVIVHADMHVAVWYFGS